MAQRTPNKPLMVEDVQSVLIPAMEKVFVNKKEFEKFKNDFNRFEEKSFDFFISKQDLADLETRIKEEMGEKFDKVLTLSDKILKNLETLTLEKKVDDYQKKRERQVLFIIVTALHKHKILTPVQIQKIKELEVF